MMKTIAITCDWCGADLNQESPMPGYFLTLSESQRRTGSMVYDIYVQRELPHDMHFCGKGCLTRRLTAAPRDGADQEGKFEDGQPVEFK